VAVDISVCMITYNKLPFVERSVPVILGSLDPKYRFEFAIWDNGSTDGTWDYLSGVRVPNNVNLILRRGKKNIGLNAYSEIAKETTGGIIVTADDDIFDIQPAGWEDRFIRVLASKFSGRLFGYVGTDTINTDGGRVCNYWGVATLNGLRVEVGPVGGWFSATTRDVYNKVGGFHSGKAAMYLEDADYQVRVGGAGYLVGTLINTKVLHARSPSYYKELNCTDTYAEKMVLAELAGLRLEPLA